MKNVYHSNVDVVQPAWYRSLQLFGVPPDDLVDWLRSQGYSDHSVRNFVQGICRAVRWLQRRRIRSLPCLTPELLARADAHFRPQRPNVSGAVRAWHRFLRVRGLIPEAKGSVLSAAQAEVERFAAYLREMRGLSERTVQTHRLRVTEFLAFIGFDKPPTSARQFRREQSERFIRRAARTNDRLSLVQVAYVLRSFLRFKFSHGQLDTPLHEEVELPRVYQGERLPKAVPWEQVRQLLRSIERSESTGARDFTMLYLAAAYGLRCGELVRLRVDDLDWRQATLRVWQRKTQQALLLPITDEAGEVLVQFLREGRPRTERRELFVRARAPFGPLKPGSVTAIVHHWLERSRLKVARFGPHALRHSLAVHLLRRGVSTKSIGDTLGHRSPSSTGVYLRLNVDDLRRVGLSVPASAKPSTLLGKGWQSRFPRIREQALQQRSSCKTFRSRFGPAIQRYLDCRRTLGLKYVMEECPLRAWDRYLCRRNAHTMDRQQFDRWAQSFVHLSPTVQRRRLGYIRQFLAHYAREHPECYVPQMVTFPKASPPRSPRLVSVEELARVLASASKLGRSNLNLRRAEVVRLGLLLLFCCGLRVGELLRLQLYHYDAKERLLRIEATKFHKSRLVPLSLSVARELEKHLAQRPHHGLPHHPESVLKWNGGNADPKAAYTTTGLTTIWKHLCLSSGVLDHRGRPPRIHDLRHSFAVEALARWYRQGVDVQARLPHLATYLGHAKISASYYYLQFTPALQAAASQRFHRAYGGLFRKGGVA